MRRAGAPEVAGELEYRCVFCLPDLKPLGGGEMRLDQGGHREMELGRKRIEQGKNKGNFADQHLKFCEKHTDGFHKKNVGDFRPSDGQSEGLGQTRNEDRSSIPTGTTAAMTQNKGARLRKVVYRLVLTGVLFSPWQEPAKNVLGGRFCAKNF
jgi:hypothetical protein